MTNTYTSLVFNSTTTGSALTAFLVEPYLNSAPAPSTSGFGEDALLPRLFLLKNGVYL